MKKYIKADSDKPLLKTIRAEWKELGNGTGIVFTVFSEYNEILFEELFDYQDVDPDNMYESAIDMAVTVLSQTYNISEPALAEILNSEEQLLV